MTLSTLLNDVDGLLHSGPFGGEKASRPLRLRDLLLAGLLLGLFYAYAWYWGLDAEVWASAREMVARVPSMVGWTG